MIAPGAWLALALAGPDAGFVSSHDDEKRPWIRAEHGASVVLWYGAESYGRLDGCGCDARPLGELSRLLGYFGRFEALYDTPTLRLDAGHWAVPAEADAPDLRSGAITELLDFDALNLTADTLAYATGNPAGWARELPTVSANVEGADQARWRVVTAGDLLVGITGVTGEILDGPVHTSDPLLALMDVLPDLRAEVDLVVVLAADIGEDAAAIAALPEIDVLIVADEFPSRLPPVDADGAWWLRAETGWRHLGELHLALTGTGPTALTHRAIEVDSDLPRDRAFDRRVARLARRPFDPE